MLQDMWDGTHVGYSTTMADSDEKYEVKNVVYDSWVDTPPVYTMTGLYTVDAALSKVEISSIDSKMYLDDDTLQACQTCPSNAISLQGSTKASDCTIISNNRTIISNNSTIISNNSTIISNNSTIISNNRTKSSNCTGGSFEEIGVLNPFEAFRTYSSVFAGHSYSQLDSFHYSASWVAGSNSHGQWMEIDASEPMLQEQCMGGRPVASTRLDLM